MKLSRLRAVAYGKIRWYAAQRSSFQDTVAADDDGIVNFASAGRAGTVKYQHAAL